MGLEPTIPGLGGQCLIHLATGALCTEALKHPNQLISCFVRHLPKVVFTLSLNQIYYLYESGACWEM